MRYLLVAVLALAVGVLGARAIWEEKPDPVDPIHVIVTQLRTHAIVEHERQVAIWYRACPDVIGVDPQLFIAWPAKLSYELELKDAVVTREGPVIKVRTAAVRADEPSVPTDFVDYLSTDAWFNFANEQELINREVRKASMIARYLSSYYLHNDSSLNSHFERELRDLVARMAAALGVDATAIEIEIPTAEVEMPKLPKIELCDGSVAAVNGLPFAHIQNGFTVPIHFDPSPSGSPGGSGTPAADTPKGIASVYGRGE